MYMYQFLFIAKFHTNTHKMAKRGNNGFSKSEDFAFVDRAAIGATAMSRELTNLLHFQLLDVGLTWSRIIFSLLGSYILAFQT